MKEAFCFTELLFWTPREGMKSHGCAFRKAIYFAHLLQRHDFGSKMFQNPWVSSKSRHTAIYFRSISRKHLKTCPQKRLAAGFLCTSSMHPCFHCGYCCCCCLPGLCRVHYMPNGNTLRVFRCLPWNMSLVSEPLMGTGSFSI